MKTINVNYATLDKATDILFWVMSDICDELATYPEYLADYGYNDWDANITAHDRDRVFKALTNGLIYDDVDRMLNTDDYAIYTAWDGIAYDVCSAADLWHRIIDCAYEILCIDYE